jgi:hypothetical protein
MGFLWKYGIDDGIDFIGIQTSPRSGNRKEPLLQVGQFAIGGHDPNQILENVDQLLRVFR